MSEFTDEEKITAFNQIADRYFNKNYGPFGSFPKANMDVLMFLIYLEHCKNAGQPTDDYALSNELGISQSRIRSLKMNIALQYANGLESGWKESFAECAKSVRYDPAKQLVKMTIPEVTVLTDLRHFIVQNGLYDEYQLNPRLFQCRLDVFIELCGLLEGDGISFSKEGKQKLKKLKAEATSKEDQSAIEDLLSGKWKKMSSR